MNILRLIGKETVGLFVDDGSLALMAIALIAVVTVLVAVLKLSPAFAEALLPLGLGLILIASVYRASKLSAEKSPGQSEGPSRANSHAP